MENYFIKELPAYYLQPSITLKEVSVYMVFSEGLEWFQSSMLGICTKKFSYPFN